MKALTIVQPNASLLIEKQNNELVMSWTTKYRGPLALHAGKEWNELLPAPPDLPFGTVIAICDLTEVNPSGDCFSWRLDNIKKLPEPIVVKGYRGLWNWSFPDDK